MSSLPLDTVTTAQLGDLLRSTGNSSTPSSTADFREHLETAPAEPQREEPAPEDVPAGASAPSDTHPEDNSPAGDANGETATADSQDQESHREPTSEEVAPNSKAIQDSALLADEVRLPTDVLDPETNGENPAAAPGETKNGTALTAAVDESQSTSESGRTGVGLDVETAAGLQETTRAEITVAQEVGEATRITTEVASIPVLSEVASIPVLSEVAATPLADEGAEKTDSNAATASPAQVAGDASLAVLAPTNAGGRGSPDDGSERGQGAIPLELEGLPEGATETTTDSPLESATTTTKTREQAFTPRQNPEPSLRPAEQTRFVQRVTKAFESIGNRGGELRLRLSPPELGAMKISLRVENGALSARIEADTTMARNALMDSLPVLRDRLAEQGVRVENFQVDVPDRHSGQTAEEQSDQPNQRRELQSEGDENESPETETRIAIDDGKLNVIA